MDKRVQIVLLGFMIYGFRFLAGGIGFSIPSISTDVLLLLSLEFFAASFGLALALFLVFRDNGQDYKRIGMEAGIAWYLIFVVIDLIISFSFSDSPLDLWIPGAFFQFRLVIIPIAVGYLLVEKGK